MPFVRVFLLFMLFVIASLARADAAIDKVHAVQLQVGNRSICTFRSAFGPFSPEERAEGARRRIETAFARPGEGWTSVKSVDQGLQVQLDGQTMFYVLPGDASELAGETAAEIAEQASRSLQKAWLEARERQDPQANVDALFRAGVAALLLLLLLTLSVKLSAKLRGVLSVRLNRWLGGGVARRFGSRMLGTFPLLIDRLLLLLTWLLALFLVFAFLTYGLRQFAVTRPASERLSQSLGSLGNEALASAAAAVPGVFVAVLIFLFTWLASRLLSEFFAGVENRASDRGWLNAHTAPATRRIVSATLWLFGFAMAYPYLPGSHTEAFKGLSVMVGLMVSIGASGVVGQIASGIIIVYTYALKQGEYVRVLDYEGTVTELGLFVTRLRTGLGEEIAIPNAVVLGNVTRNFSRIRTSQGKHGYVLDTTVTIGYDTPWRQVHAMLDEAARATPEVLSAPAPYVVQTALSDFYVAYKLVVHVGTDVPATRARVVSDLHAAIQDAFNRHGVQIMSPHYYGDPKTPKLVPESNWHEAPANRPASGD